MRVIYKIARLELSNLFFSPVAWFLLVVLVFITGYQFTGRLEELSRAQAYGSGLYALSGNLFYGLNGLWVTMKQILYFAMPLLTMGLISQEYGLGSIKLLYSSPISTRQIVVGKYLGIMMYGLLVSALLCVPVAVAAVVVENFEWQAVLTGLLGLYLLWGLYSAIGLFMSALTNYQLVSAICMLVTLYLLKWVSGVGQEYPVVRDITYWLSIESRADNFIKGLICSEDVLYFVILSVMFVCFAVLRMQMGRERRTGWSKAGRYVGVFVAAMLLGYLTSRPMVKFYYDSTYTKSNTLSETSQEIVNGLEGGLTITTYSNLLGHDYRLTPRNVRRDMDRYENFLRFKPETELKYVFYYAADTASASFKHYHGSKTVEEAARYTAELTGDNLRWYLTPEEISKNADVVSHDYKFLSVVERENGQKAYLRAFNDTRRLPSEKEISAVLRSFLVPAPRIGFLETNTERRLAGRGNGDYHSLADESFRFSPVNQGFDVFSVSVEENRQMILDSLDVLMVSDPSGDYAPEVMETLREYVRRGKNLILAVKPDSYERVAPLASDLGLSFEPGILVETPREEVPANVVSCEIPEAGQAGYSRYFNVRQFANYTVPGASPIVVKGAGGFTYTPTLVTKDKRAWNERQTIDFINERATADTLHGERVGERTVMVSLTRTVNDREQRIVVMGDADLISEGELGSSRRGVSSANGVLTDGIFGWLVYDELPLRTGHPRPIDNHLSLSMGGASAVTVVLKWAFPAAILVFGAFVLARRRRK